MTLFVRSFYEKCLEKWRSIGHFLARNFYEKYLEKCKSNGHFFALQKVKSAEEKGNPKVDSKGHHQDGTTARDSLQFSCRGLVILNLKDPRDFVANYTCCSISEMTQFMHIVKFW